MIAIAIEAARPPSALARAREGDHDAFAEIVAEHESMVYSIALHSLSDRTRAEEIAQDVFLQLYRKLNSIDDEAHLLHWLRQVTTRRCIDQIRRTHIRAVPLEYAGELTHDDRASDPLFLRRIRELVATLPELQRTIVVLRYQEDLDPAEICRIVGMPVNTVKSHLHRALQLLRRRLGDQR